MHFGGGSKMGNSQPKLKLTYFGLRGRGEASRWLLAYAGAEYEDHRIAFEQWPELKPSECKNIFLKEYDYHSFSSFYQDYNIFIDLITCSKLKLQSK